MIFYCYFPHHWNYPSVLCSKKRDSYHYCHYFSFAYVIPLTPIQNDVQHLSHRSLSQAFCNKKIFQLHLLIDRLLLNLLW